MKITVRGLLGLMYETERVNVCRESDGWSSVVEGGVRIAGDVLTGVSADILDAPVVGLYVSIFGYIVIDIE